MGLFGTFSFCIFCSFIFYTAALPYRLTEEESVKYHGLTQTEFEEAVKLKKEIYMQEGAKIDYVTDNIEDDIAYTAEQLRYLKEMGKPRHKRKVYNFDKFPSQQWNLPIAYTFAPSFEQADIDAIRYSIASWTSMTCLLFYEMSDDVAQALPAWKPFVNFTNTEDRCWSYVGRTNQSPQIVNLGGSCMSQPGIPTHEIGHVIGLWHEHARPDRDQYVDVLVNNIDPNKLLNFEKIEDQAITDGIPYDYGSLMHYKRNAFKKKDFIADTLVSLRGGRGLYQGAMGQRTHISFYDAKIINNQYCKDRCVAPLPCMRGGYTNPKDCKSCLCPEGFTGKHCEFVQPFEMDPCGGTHTLSAANPKLVLNSPNDPRHWSFFVKYYKEGQSCTWYIKTEPGHRLKFSFLSKTSLVDFEVGWTSAKQCMDFVEIKDSDDFGNTGVQYCGNVLPKVTQISKNNDALVLFRTNGLFHPRGGFKLLVSTEVDPTKTTTTTPTTTTTSTTTTTTTPTTTTTTPTTTTTTPTTTTTTPTTTTTTPTTTTTTPTTTTKTQPPPPPTTTTDAPINAAANKLVTTPPPTTAQPTTEEAVHKEDSKTVDQVITDTTPVPVSVETTTLRSATTTIHLEEATTSPDVVTSPEVVTAEESLGGNVDPVDIAVDGVTTPMVTRTTTRTTPSPTTTTTSTTPAPTTTTTSTTPAPTTTTTSTTPAPTTTTTIQNLPFSQCGACNGERGFQPPCRDTVTGKEYCCDGAAFDKIKKMCKIPNWLYGAWTPWTTCNLHCGCGQQTRFQFCVDDEINGGQGGCYITEVQPCVNRACTPFLCLFHRDKSKCKCCEGTHEENGLCVSDVTG